MSAQNTAILPDGPEAIAEAARLILAGQPVAMPTETVYGLAADAANGEAVARIYAAKGRPSFNPLIVHVLDMAQAEAFGALPSDAARDIADNYWPGSPLTIVVPFVAFPVPGKSVAEIATAGRGTVALRSPSHPAMRALIEACGRPLAAPSANRSGHISPTKAVHVLNSLGGRIPLIVDGGETQHGLESTIIKVADRTMAQLRPGPVDAEEIAVFANLKYDTVWAGKIEAPGQLESHYAPNKPLRLNVAEPALNEWLIGFGSVAGNATLSASGDLVEAAANLFEKLHEAEAAPSPKIAVAPIPDEGIGVAINDRLRRAAAPR